MSQIHILDGQEDIILDYITAKNIISDNHKKSLEDTLETYDFITFADKRFSEFLEKRNRIIIPDEDESLREFIIFEGQRYRDTEGHKVQVFANASYLELKKASIIYPNTFKGTASQHAGRALNDTGWQVGIVEVSGDVTITISEHTNPYENLKRISKEFKAELRFRIEHDGSKVIGRYVDLLERVGDWQGREVTFGKDLDSIRRVEKQDVVTALLGLGPEKEDSTRLEVLVEDEEALQRWGRIDKNGKLKHLIEVYEIQSERTEMTKDEARQYTRTALDKRINTQVTYETTIVDLEEVVGHENKKIRFGDTIRIKDEKFNPPLYLEARVFEINRSIKSKAKKDIKLGDYIEYTEEEVNTLWEQLKKEIQDRLARLVIATVVSSGGDVFKNGIGTTQLTAKTFVNGHEVDEDSERYEYQWIKFDKDSKQVDGFIETGKTLNVTANDIDEKATYRVLIAYGLDVVTTSEYTLTHLFDGAEGKPGKDGKDGKSSYTHVRYSQNANGSGMTTNPTNAVYIGIAITESPVAPTTANEYEWSKIKGDDGVGTPGADGKTSYVHIKYSNDGGKTFTSNNGEDPGDYIGTYTDFVQADSNDVNKYTWAKVKGEKGEPGERGLQGLQGPEGKQGIPGAKGADGRTSYTHIAYADTASGGGFSQNPANKKYIGMYVDFTAQDSTDPSKYKWSLIKGADGTQGVPGPAGADGKTPYFHTAWANNATGTSGFSTTVSANKLYIGTYTDFTQADSNDPSKYNWTKIKGDKGDKGDTGPQGIPGQKGADGKTYYTWVKYANTPTSGMSDNPSGKDYIGFAYNKESPTMSTKYSDYTWSLFKGPQGVQGQPGADGEPTYTWVKYADDKDGNGMSDSPDNKKYIGLAFNQKTATESTNKGDYQWSLMPQNIEISDVNLVLNSYKKVNGTAYRITGYDLTLDWVAGEKWTVVVKGELNEGQRFGIWANGSSSNQVYTTDLGNGYHRATFTVRKPTESGTNSGPKIMNVYNYPSTTAQTASIEWIKLVRGDHTSLSWSPAPEDVDKSIQKVQTTADGKNTIYRQNTQPSTSGRKVGDVWFKTDDDNKMHTFDGTKWNPATFGEQAITAESITALHIKSLNDLNVNDQFIVDKNGNVFFKGNLTGASGTFSGTVSGAQIKGSLITLDKALNEDSNIGLTGTYDHVDTRYGRPPIRYQGTVNLNSAYLSFRSKTTIAEGTNEQYHRYQITDLGANSIDMRVFRNSTNSSETGAFNGNETAISYSGREITFYRGGTSNTNTTWDTSGTIDPIHVSMPIISATEELHAGVGGRVHGEGGSILRIGAGYIASMRFYDNTSTATTNMLRVTSSGVVSRSTSSRRYKLAEEPLSLEKAKRFLNISAKTWYDKEFCETYADALNYQDKSELQENYGKEQVRRIPGLIAEDLHYEGLYEYVEYDDEGRPDGISMYAWTPLLELVKDLYKRVEELGYGRSAV